MINQVSPMITESSSKINGNRFQANSYDNKKAAEKAATEFEKLIFQNLAKQLFSSTQDSSIWGNSGHASSLIRSLFIEAISDKGASGLGMQKAIAKALYADPTTSTQVKHHVDQTA